MLRYLYILFIISVFFGVSKGQNQKQIDSIIYKINNTSGIKKAKTFCLAANYYKRNKPDTAILLSRNALQLNTELNNDTIQSNALGNIAECYANKSQFDSATAYYVKAIVIAEKIGSQKKMASYNNGLGMVFYQLGDIQKSIVYMQKAAAIKLKEGDVLYYATINCNIAGALQRLGKYNEAIAILRDSESKLKSFDNVEIIANLYNSLGSAYQLQSKNIDSVEYYYKKCIDLITNPELDYYRLAAYINISDLYIEKNKLDLAEQNIFKALSVVNKLNLGIEKIKTFEILSHLYEKKNDFPKALNYKKLQLSLRDSLINSEKEQIIQELDKKYQTEKKDSQIKEQELIIEKDANKRNKLIILFILVVFVLIIVTVYFLFKKQSQKAIERAKQKFFSNVVHEIRTPLSMIQAPLSLLKKNKNTEEEQYQINLAEKSIKRLNELVNQMLDISKIETQKYKLNNAFGDIRVFFEELGSYYSAIAFEKNISLITQINFQSTLLYFDKDALEKITGNLLSNAIKYTKSNKQIGLTVNINELEEDVNLEIIVWDTGIGISKKDQENIFERFYRGSESLAHASGVGIGLSLVNDLVLLYNGSINLKSEVNKGSTFTVNIKLKKPDNVVLELNNTSHSTDQKQILIVEDDASILEFNSRLLQNNNYTVLQANNGIEALQIIEKTLPDLIISDVMMPGMDGLEFLTNLKNNEVTNHIPIIFLSAKSTPNSRIDVLSLGAQSYLTKPFLPDELLALVKNQLAILTKKQVEFEEKIKEPEKTVEEKFVGTEPYTQKLFKLIFTNLDSSELTVEFLADLMATNRSHFQRKLKSITGFSPSELIKIIRLEKAKEFLIAKKGNITEVAYMVGFSSQSYFTKCFTDYFKNSPSEMLQKHH
ncbi:MAG: response regulator [Bacteroidota bacterium]|nr:response regulator [Bacteroidota bacterium]